jgi:hypothetical protein
MGHKDPEKAREYRRNRYAANPEKDKETNKRYRAAHREEINAAQRTRNINKALGRVPRDTAPIRLRDPVLTEAFAEQYGREPTAAERTRAAKAQLLEYKGEEPTPKKRKRA